MEMHSLSPFRNEAQKVMKQFLRKIANNSRMNLDQVNEWSPDLYKKG